VSRTEHIVFCLKIGGPSSKPKYYLVTDSEQVLWRKGKKNSCEESEIDLKPDAYKQSEGNLYPWWRAFCIMSQRVNLICELKPLGVGQAKASLNRALSMLN